jgi:hypothetical protein
VAEADHVGLITRIWYQTTEVGIIGREGLVGLPVVMGAESASTKALVQMPGTALRVPAAELRAAFEASAALRAVVLSYAQAFHAQVAPTAACNGRHLPPLVIRVAHRRAPTRRG